MGTYVITGAEDVVTGNYTTALNLTGATTRRPEIFDFLFGQGAVPGDNTILWALQRHTAPGTLTAVTPNPIDPADPASVATAGENATVEPTITANSELFELPINQRGSYRWVASPGRGLIIPATANNGISARIKSSAYTGTGLAIIHFRE